MLSLDEVIKEQEKEKAKSELDSHVSIKQTTVLMQLSERNLRSQPSFFKKMFSIKNMDKVFVGDDDDESDDNEEEKVDPDASTANVTHNDDADDEQKEKEVSAEKIEMDSKYAYYDPPLPKFGAPINMDKLVSRNQSAELGLKKLMEMVIYDVDHSLKETKVLPVAHGYDRVTVTEEHSKRIGKVKNTKEIERTVNSNISSIQKALNYRKSALIMMNSNYSNKLVRLIEPIYVSEARTLANRVGDLAAPKLIPDKEK
jgi:hypothetical protein